MAIIDGHIRCNRCRESRPLDAFAPSIVLQKSGTCRECLRAYRASRPDKEREYQLKFYAKNPGYSYKQKLAKKYGLTKWQYDALLESQGGGCACCGAKANPSGRRLFVDHDHETGAIRGILCHGCNAGIGSLGDSIEGLRRALRYLERAQQRQSPVRMMPGRRLGARRASRG